MAQEKTNIAELLKDCPTCMELDCIMFEKPVKYMGQSMSETYMITIRTSYDKNFYLTKEGFLYDMPDSKCIIFPKGKTTWEGFVPPYQFKDGDVVVNASNKYSNAFIYAGENNDYYACYLGLTTGTHPELSFNKSVTWVRKKMGLRLATEEEKQKLFQAIKDNGYKWNGETKTLEQLIEPKFKVGDKVRHKNNHNIAFTITSIAEDSYICGSKAAFWFDDQDNYELVPNKFDISSLKPFDKVLVRDNDTQEWHISFFSHCNGLECYKYSCINGTGYAQCIPYEANKELLGTTNNPE